MPSLMERIMARFGYLRADSRLPMVVRTIGERGAQQGFISLDNAENQMKAYQQVSWVYAAIARIVNAGAFVPFSVVRKAQEEEEEIVDHGFERLLRRPNPFMARYQLWEQVIGFMELAGNAYLYLNIVGGKPAEMWPLRPDRMRVVPDKQKYIKGWVYELEGREVSLKPQEVVHFPLWHPRSDWVGLSPIEAASLAAETDNRAAEYNRNFFGDEVAIPAGAWVLPEDMPDPVKEKVKKEYIDSFGGTGLRTAFLRAGTATWESVGLSQRDMQWLEGREFNQREIMTGIYGIPPGLYRENATEANAKIAMQFFLEQTMWPMLVRIAEIVTARILWPFWGDEIEGRFEDIRPEQRDLDIKEMQVAMNPLMPILTVDEARRRYFDLGPMEIEETPEQAEELDKQEEEARRRAYEQGYDPTQLVPTEREQKAEVEKWERKARRWLKEQGTADAPFQAATLSPGIQGAIRHRLKTATTPEEVKAAFAVPF